MNYVKAHPNQFREGQRFKNYPEQADTFVIKSIHLDKDQGLATVIFYKEGDEDTDTDLWQGRLDEDETLCGFLFVLEDELPQEPQQTSVGDAR
jgi:hypothetical protein